MQSKCEKAIGNNNIEICTENCDGYKDFTKGIKKLEDKVYSFISI